MFTILLALAVKSVLTFYDWAKDRAKKSFDQKHGKLNDEENLQQRLQRGDSVMKALTERQDLNDVRFNKIEQKIDLLIESDKDDIKSYITREHHYFCYQVGWIDDFSLECLQKRYNHYKDEGGNSFIGHFMDDLRRLPKKDPQQSNHYPVDSQRR